VTGSTDATDATDAADTEGADGVDEAKPDPPKRKRGAVREAAILLTIAVVLYYVMLTFVARPYLSPS
jgi:signal peptidase I